MFSTRKADMIKKFLATP